MVFTCPLCQNTYEKRVELDKHLQVDHADKPSPYSCDMCTTMFGSEKAMLSHKRKRHVIDDKMEDTKRVKKSSIDFTDWVTQYYNPRKSLVKEKLSESTIQRIIGFETGNVLGCTISELLFEQDDEESILNRIDTWVDDELQKYELQTINNHVRYLYFLVLYYTETRQCNHDHIIQYMDDLVHNTQLLTSKSASTINVLKLEDPYALSAIRDRVVDALTTEQVEHIDPYITQFIHGNVNADNVYTFGIRLRNWLELAIRFTNIPCRIQCTRDMRTTTYGKYDYVSKLIQHVDQYHRLINMDKTGSTTHQPISIPLDKTLSMYLYYYVTYFRPGDSDYVFVTKNGTKWTKPSRDLKVYLNDVLNIPVADIDPTGRFIHASRAIMMAAFSIRVDFNISRMHEFARLMRHSSTTSEHYYSIWQQKYASENAINTFSRVFGVDIVTSHDESSVKKKSPVGLRMPSSIIRHHYDSQTNKDGHFYRYATYSVGTQTNFYENDDNSNSPNREIDIAATIPPCPSCNEQSLDVYGPFGSKRRKWYYGRYYLACAACHRDSSDKTRFRLTSCLWYPLGYKPLQKSNSSKPRNMEDICKYICDTTT